MNIIAAIISLILAITTLLFGNNILDSFKRADFVYSTNKVSLDFSPDLTLSSKNINNSIIPDTYRELIIKNTGAKSSTNVKLHIKLDGNIINSKISSIEDIAIYKVDKSEIRLSMNRLTNGANVEFKLWLKQNPAVLEVNLLDDQGTRRIPDEKYIQEKYIQEKYIIPIISFIVILILLSFIVFNKFIKPKNETIKIMVDKQETLEKEKISLQEKNSDLEASLKELRPTGEVDLLHMIAAFVQTEENRRK